jgi:prolyl-tRNA synthetase
MASESAEVESTETRFVEDLAEKDDFAQWYQDVVYKAGLADESPVRGCMTIKPYGYALWEHMQRAMDDRIKATGHENVYFPLFIPASFLEREAEHVEGFAPEVAVVTRAGGEELAEPLVVRPTSETVIGHMYAKWVQSYRDLPRRLNPWCKVVRWVKRTRPFLRTTEFLWQEGHTVHRTEQEAEDETLLILRQVYEDFFIKELAIPGIPGLKSESQKFPGALRTYTIEAMMGDGKALQASTSHNLGQNFARGFGIQFQDADGVVKTAWTTSWGASTRMIGEVEAALRAAGVRVRADWREERPGFKYTDWELRGVPIRIEIGPRDAQNGQVVLVPRTDRTKKETVGKDGVARRVPEMLAEIHQALYDAALAFRQSRTYRVSDYAELKAIMADRERLGFVETWWCGDGACEAAIKADTGATIRCMPLEQPEGSGPCVYCGRAGAGTRWAIFGKAY